MVRIFKTAQVLPAWGWIPGFSASPSAPKTKACPLNSGVLYGKINKKMGRLL